MRGVVRSFSAPTSRPLLVRLRRRSTGAPGNRAIGSPRGRREAAGPVAAAIETHLRVSDEGITFTPVPTSGESVQTPQRKANGGGETRERIMMGGLKRGKDNYINPNHLSLYTRMYLTH